MNPSPETPAPPPPSSGYAGTQGEVRPSEADLRDYWEEAMSTYQSASGRRQIAVEVAHKLFTAQSDLAMANFIATEARKENAQLRSQLAAKEREVGQLKEQLRLANIDALNESAENDRLRQQLAQTQGAAQDQQNA